MECRFPAASVVANHTCCDAAREIGDRIFLAADAPPLPLPQCTMPDGCKCHYRKYPDRRQGDDDRRMFGETRRSVMYGGAERRRKPRGRRADD